MGIVDGESLLASKLRFGSDYPLVESAIVPLRDGTSGVLREVVGSDRDSIGNLYERLTPRQRYTRFFTPTNHTTASRLGLRDSSITDPECNYDVVVSTATGKAIGHAGFTLFSRSSRWGEMHFVVDPGHQGNGIGKHLAQRTAVAGNAFGLIGVTATVKTDNQPMLAILHTLPYELGVSSHKMDEETINVDGMEVVRFLLKFDSPGTQIT
jgi:RimJ/RimL family protein N-acetyltransferase